MSTSAERHVSLERRGAVGLIHLDRPAKRNAYTPLMCQQIEEAFVELDADPGVRVIVLTGRGGHFGVGADLDVNWRDHAAHSVEVVSRPEWLPWNLATPIISAINGDAVGASLTWAVQTDIRVVAEEARLAFSFNKIGIMPERNSVWLLPRLIGFGAAADLLLTGRTFSGREAKELGLATHCVPASEVLDTALRLAEQLAERCAPVSTTVTKRLLYEFLEQGDRLAAYNRERRTGDWVRAQGETLRGVAAFKERRAPEWGTTKHIQIPPELR
jgi:enoyl-CoA hydratase/carnithine racemase